MRAAAEIEPVALLVDRDFLVGRNGVDQFDLERLAMRFEIAHGLVAAPFLAHDRLVGGDDLAHFLFDRREILGRERLGAEKVVIEAVLDHRADGDLRAGKKRLDRVGQHMGGVVADQLQRARVVAVEEFDLGVGADRRRRRRPVWPSSTMATVLLASEGEMLLAMSRPVAPGSIGTRRAIGKSDRNHPSLLAHSPRRAGVSFFGTAFLTRFGAAAQRGSASGVTGPAKAGS